MHTSATTPANGRSNVISLAVIRTSFRTTIWPDNLIDNSKNNLNKIVLFRQTLNAKHGFLFFLFPVHLVLSTLVTMIFICGNGGLEFFQHNYPMEYCQRLVLFLVFFIAIEIEERSKPNFNQLLRSLYLSIHYDDILVRMFEDVITEFKMSTYTIGNTFEIDIKCMLVILLQFANVLIQTKLVIFFAQYFNFQTINFYLIILSSGKQLAEIIVCLAMKL